MTLNFSDQARGSLRPSGVVSFGVLSRSEEALTAFQGTAVDPESLAAAQDSRRRVEERAEVFLGEPGSGKHSSQQNTMKHKGFL